MTHRRIATSALLATALAVPLAVVTTDAGSGAAAACTSRTTDDFDGDGHADLIASDNGVRSPGSGGMRVVYGGAAGFAGAGNQYVDASSSGIPGATGIGTYTTGFFGGDCYADLAFVVTTGSGASTTKQFVAVVSGSPDGLVFAHPVLTPIAGADVDGDRVPVALASGDFNGDGAGDLALSFPQSDGNEDTKFVPGAAGMLYGDADGLTLTGAAYFTQGSQGVPGLRNRENHFADALAAADFNGDGKTDLAVGAPGTGSYGTVTILPGSAAGLTGTGAQEFDGGTTGVAGPHALGDRFGSALAAADITGDGRADLVIGTPDQARGTGVNLTLETGGVTVLYSTPSGLSAAHSQHWEQDSPGVPGVGEAWDRFGASVTAGDFNGDGYADVAIGAPGEDIGTVTGAGSITVLYGHPSGLTATGSTARSQRAPGVQGTAEKGDAFGTTARALNIASNKYADLVIGVFNEDSAGHTDNGALNVLRGSSHGITAIGDQFIDGSALRYGTADHAHLHAGPVVEDY